MSQRLSKALLAFGLVAANPVPATAQGTAASPILHEEAKLLASDGGAFNYFGYSVAISGERLVVGAWGDEPSGSVYVFERDDTGTWTQTAKLLASDGKARESFGRSVALSEETLVVGASTDDDLCITCGSAYVFERDETGTWIVTAKLLASDGGYRDRFGHSVAISGDRLVVGTWGDSDLGHPAGAAYVFERDDTGTWTEVAKLLASDGEDGDNFGESVAISGETLVVGAHDDDDLGFDSGSVYVFERDDRGTWTQTAKLLASDGAPEDCFGQSVAISGDRLFVGAHRDDDLGDGAGSAHVFERDDTGTWAEVAKLLASDGQAGDLFGFSVAVSGERLVVGAENDDDPIYNSGAAYVFERDDTGTWAEVAMLLPSDGAINQNFGWSVAISEDRLVVGAWGDDDLGDSSGSAYVFSLEDCVLDLRLSPETVRAGEDLRVALHLEHNRPQIVTVPFLLWIEDAAGRVVAERSSPPITMEPGDHRQLRMAVTLPSSLPAGTYRVLVGVRRMQQGIAWVSQEFQVVQ